MDGKPSYEELERRIALLESDPQLNHQTPLQLLDSEIPYRLILESISETVIITDDLGNLIYVCPNTTNIFKFSQEEIYAQKTIQKIMNGSVCDITELKSKGEIENIERPIKDSTGDVRHLSINAKSIAISNGTILYVMRDITAHKQILKQQKNIVKHENEQAAIVYNSPMAIAFGYPDGRLENANASFSKLTGYTLSELQQINWNEVLTPPRWRASEMEELSQLSPSNKSVRYEKEYICKDGKHVPIELTVTAKFNSAGIIVHYIGFISDITERKQSEETLRLSNDRYKSLFMNMVSGVAIYEVIGNAEDFIFKDFNRSAEKIDNEKRETLIGRSIFEARPHIESFGLINVFREVWKTGKPKHHPVTLYQGNVLKLWYENFVYRSPSGEIVAIFSNQTERKKAEKALNESEKTFQIAMEATKDGLYDWDLLTNEIYYSPGWKIMLGYKDNELPNNFSIWEKLTKPKDKERSWKMQQELINKKRNRFKIEFKMKHKDGHWLDILSRARAIFDDNGKAIRIVGTHVDITDQKKSEREKRILEQKLFQAQKMESIGNLAGGIAHDFNNILSSIIGFTELALEAAPKGSSQKDDLEEVYIAGNRAKELVQQILAFARQSGKETKPVRLDDIITEVLKLLRPSTPTTIDIKPTINSTAKVMGNDSQLHQIIMNLCTNAIHSLQKSGDVLEIAIEDIFLGKDSELETSKLPSGEYVELTITDNGPGIEPEIIENIFEPYFTTKGVGEGSGMGLAMVDGIVESYGGDIHVKSEPEKQTTFAIRFPVATGKRFEALDPVDPVASGTERILFVDDEPPIARMGSRMLEGLGYTVTIRTSSFEALELFKEKPDAFDLIITDMTMPAMTGDELSIEIRKIRHDIPIILCTGYSNKINDEGAKKIGIDAFAYKPFSKFDLAKTIREVLDTNRSSSV